MSFPITYREIRRLVLEEVWETETARAIARKAGLKIAGASPFRVPDAASTFSWMNDHEGDYCYIGSHDAELEPIFPRDTPTIYSHPEDIMTRQADFEGVYEARLIANVTGVGTANSRLMVVLEDGELNRGFVIEPPSVPLDEVGLHVSEWQRFSWDATQTGFRRARTRWLIDNPGGLAGDFYVGFCQLQTR